jgi:hypothetical protein
MVPEVDELDGLSYRLDDSSGDGFGVSRDRNDAAVMSCIHFRIEQRHTRRRGKGCSEYVDYIPVASFAEIGNALYDSLQGCSNLLMTTFPFLMVTTQ